jgi:phosphohistidine phosphatase
MRGICSLIGFAPNFSSKLEPSKNFSSRHCTITSRLIVYILRHGEAEAKSSQIADDERHLTTRGRSKLRRNLKVAKEIGTKIDLILTSPLVRAKESAEIVRDVFGIEGFVIEEMLEPMRSPYEVYQTLAKHVSLESLLIVTHQPLISSLMNALLSWDESFFAFPVGTITKIEIKDLSNNPRGILHFLLPSLVE